MNDLSSAGTYRLGDRTVSRIGYGAMQLAGPGVFGPPRDPDAARAVLRAAIAAGVDHIDTSDFYGPHVTNGLIREALHPYPETLVIVTKVGAVRGDDASWNEASTPDALERAVHDNLRNLDLQQLAVVNLRLMGGADHGPAEGSVESRLAPLIRLREQGLIGAIGLSNATETQVDEARAITSISCVQNLYNLVHRRDDALIDRLAADNIAFVPFFPLGGFSPLQSDILSTVATQLGATPMQVALRWLLQRAPNILLIPGTASAAHLRENLAVADITIPAEQMAVLDGIGVAPTTTR